MVTVDGFSWLLFLLEVGVRCVWLLLCYLFIIYIIYIFIGFRFIGFMLRFVLVRFIASKYVWLFNDGLVYLIIVV